MKQIKIFSGNDYEKLEGDVNFFCENNEDIVSISSSTNRDVLIITIVYMNYSL